VPELSYRISAVLTELLKGVANFVVSEKKEKHQVSGLLVDVLYIFRKEDVKKRFSSGYFVPEGIEPSFTIDQLLDMVEGLKQEEEK